MALVSEQVQIEEVEVDWILTSLYYSGNVPLGSALLTESILKSQTELLSPF